MKKHCHGIATAKTPILASCKLALGLAITPGPTQTNRAIMESTSTQTQLTPLPVFERSGRCPVNARWLVFHQREALQEAGAIVRYGTRRWLVNEQVFLNWLVAHGEGFSTPRREAEAA